MFVEKQIPSENRRGRFLALRSDYFLVSFSQQPVPNPFQKTHTSDSTMPASQP